MSLAETARLLDHPKLSRSGLRGFSVVFGASYGQLPSASEEGALKAVVKRYYGFAAQGNGRGACSMIVKSRAKAFPIEYAGSDTIPYLRGAKTCQEVLSRMFKRGHSVLKWPVKVTGVLVQGNLARAFVDSRTVPISVLPLERDGDGWKVSAPLAGTLPLTGFRGPLPLKGLTR